MDLEVYGNVWPEISKPSFGYLISSSALSRPFQLLGHVPRERAPFETPNSPFKQCGESILAWAFFAYILFDFYTPFPVEIYEFLLAVYCSGTVAQFSNPVGTTISLNRSSWRVYEGEILRPWRSQQTGCAYILLQHKHGSRALLSIYLCAR